MKLYFGKITDYIDDRGFGFITTVLPKSLKKIFFHINAIEKNDSDFAKKIMASKYQNIFFWFEIEKNEKGYRLKKIIKDINLIKNLKSDENVVENIITLWDFNKNRNIDSWLPEITETILGNEKKLLLETVRQSDLNKEEEKYQQYMKQIELEAKIKIDTYIKNISSYYNLNTLEKLKSDLLIEIDENIIETKIIDFEFNKMVEEFSTKNITRSADITNYIMRNQIGRKYQYISGNLSMRSNDGQRDWNFKGGISPKYFAQLCNTLGLKHKGTESHVVDFQPFSKS